MSNYFCTYDKGMFPCYPDDPETEIGLDDVVATHEAAHAVAAYALGLGCKGIALRATFHDRSDSRGFEKWSLSGIAFSTFRPPTRVRLGDYSPALACIGIMCAAGAAAERKLALDIGVLPQLTLEADQDHQTIDKIDKGLGFRHNRTHFAFRRLVWHKTQRLVAYPACWAAIQDIAAQLAEWYCPGEYYPAEGEDAPGDHSSFEIMSGQKARAIMRRNGVTPGIFGISAASPNRNKAALPPQPRRRRGTAE